MNRFLIAHNTLKKMKLGKKSPSIPLLNGLLEKQDQFFAADPLTELGIRKYILILNQKLRPSAFNQNTAEIRRGSPNVSSAPATPDPQPENRQP